MLTFIDPFSINLFVISGFIVIPHNFSQLQSVAYIKLHLKCKLYLMLKHFFRKVPIFRSKKMVTLVVGCAEVFTTRLCVFVPKFASINSEQSLAQKYKQIRS